MNTDESVASILASYQRAVFDRDVDAFMRLYDPSVRVFDTWGAWCYENAAAWRTSVHGWLSSLGDDRVRVTVDDVRVLGEKPLVVVSAVFRYAGISSAGVELRSMQNRLTWTLQYGEAWKIVHEHTSMPVSPDDSKAIFHRPRC
jgi:ketosteroid isomerase-like protein